MLGNKEKERNYVIFLFTDVTGESQDECSQEKWI